MQTYCPKSLNLGLEQMIQKWVDAHSHWADERLDSFRQEWLKEAIARGLAFSLQGGVGPEDWARQETLQSQFPGKIGTCFGLHPYWVAAHSATELEEGLDLLSQKINKAVAVGETGLDLRPQYEASYELQIEAFQAQLELATVANKPLVFHFVRAFEESLSMFDFWGVPPRGGMVHSFNGSWPQAQEYLQRGLKISLGGPLIRSQNQKLKQVAKEIPIEQFLIETDLPDQPGDAWKGRLNPPESLLAVAEEIARLKSLSTSEVLHLAETNFKTLFQVEI